MRWHCASQRPATGGSHCSPHALFVIPSPQSRPVSIWHDAEQPSQLFWLPSSHCSGGHATPSPHPVSRRQFALHPSQLVVFPSSHSSPGSRRPLPQTAVDGGSSIFTNFPRPGSSGPPGSFEVQVQMLLSGSNSMSRVKLARLGSGKTVKRRSGSGSKRIIVSESVPLIHTAPVRRLG